MAVLALVPFGTGAGADPTFVTGSGRARASLFEVVPRTGGLEIPVNFGKALTTYQGLSATATSGGVKPPSQETADGDCGGGPEPPGGGGGDSPAPPSLGGGNPGMSFPWVSTLSVSTGDQDAEKGREIDQGSFPAGSPISGRFEHQQVWATAAPSAKAITTSAFLAVGPLIEVTGGRTEAETGVVDGRARLARAVTTMDRLRLLDGLIELVDVRWEATQRTGEAPVAEGGFTVGQVLFQGKPLPAPPAPPVTLPGGSPPALPDPLVALNTALAPSGLALERPDFDTAGGVARVAPLTLRFADSELGRVVLAPLVTGLQPLRDPVVGGLLAISCDFGMAVTVADVATSVLTGSGGIRFDIGGVTATTEGEVYDNPLAGGFGDGGGLGGGLGDGDFGALPEVGSDPSPSTAFASPVADGTLPSGSTVDAGPLPGNGFGGPSDTNSVQGGSGASVGPAPTEDEFAFTDPNALFGSASRHVPGHKGGRALAVAALALLTVGALAAADAFHLRRASRSIS